MLADSIFGNNISPCGVIPVNPPILPPGPQPTGRVTGPTGPTGATGPVGPTGAAGPAGSIAATIPFSVSKYGVSLVTDTQGEPLAVIFAGFGTAGYYPEYLQEGEWATGSFTIRENMASGPTFIQPHSGVLRNIYVMFSTNAGVLFEEQAIIRPFVCLAVSPTQELTFTILQDTMTFAEPYTGGIEYPKHTIRRGALANLDVNLAEGTLVGIVAGIMAENVTAEQYGMFTISGGLFIQ